MTGAQAEDLACRYLQQQGLKLLDRNYRCRMGEIDLILEQNGELVFAEVRFRTSKRFGGAPASVDPHKQKRLIRAAGHYLQHKGWLDERPARFDVVSLHPGRPQPEIQWLPNAFGCD